MASPATQTAANAECAVPCLTIDRFGLPATDAQGAASGSVTLAGIQAASVTTAWIVVG